MPTLSNRPGDPPAQLVRDLAGLLDLEIAEVQEHMRPRLALSGGAGISLRLDDSRLIVDAVRPPAEPDGWYFSLPSGSTFPQITVSVLRPPEQIAKEISRRFLPDYRRLWSSYETAVAEHRAYLARVTELRDRVRRALGDRWDVRDETRAHLRPSSTNPVVHLTFTNELYGDIRISGDGAKFELNVTGADIVEAIAGHLGLCPKKKES